MWMPELPEVETIVRGLDRKISGKTIEKITVFDEELLRNVDTSELKRECEGQNLTAVRRKGKYILLEIGGDRLLAIHLRMTGKMLLREKGEATDYQRVSFGFRGNGQLIMDNMRRFGTLDLLTDEKQEPLASLGIEPFTDSYHWEDFRELFETTQSLKLTLLDQKKITGLGNIYANEALFRAGLNPLIPGEDVSESGLKKLYETIPKVLEEAIEQNGTTFSTFRDSSGDSGNFQNFLDVYQKEGEFCPRCGAEIIKVDQSGRGTYYCPTCQEETEEDE